MGEETRHGETRRAEPAETHRAESRLAESRDDGPVGLVASSFTRAAVAAGTAGEVIKLARKARNWRQQDLAENTGYSQPTISRIELGETRAAQDIHVLADLADALDIPHATLGITNPGDATRAGTPPPRRPAPHNDPDTEAATRPALAQLRAAVQQHRSTAGLTQRELATRTGFSFQYIGLIERPGSSLPSANVIDAIEKILNTHGELRALQRTAQIEAAALRTTPDTEEPAHPGGADKAEQSSASSPPTTYGGDGGQEDHDMHRRAFLTAASAALFTRPEITGAAELPEYHDTLPARLGATDVAALREMTTRLRAVADAHGTYAGLLSPAVQHAEQLLSVPAADEVRRDLLSVTGELHRLAGWDAHDVGTEVAARAHLRRSMELCSAAEDVYQACWTCRLAGVQAEQHGRPQDALHLFQMAQTRLTSAHPDDPRVPHLVARLHGETARSLVQLGENARARHELAVAWDTTDTPQKDIPYLASIVERFLGNTDRAEEYAERVAQRYAARAAERPTNGPDTRQLLFSSIMLADLRVATREHSGLTMAEQVIQAVKATRSTRARHKLGALARTLNERGHRDLSEQARHVIQG